MQATTACTRARGRKHSPVHPAFLPASGEPSASHAARSLAALLRILCHFCASTPAEQPASGCLTCLSVHCRATFVLHRQAGTAGTNHCPCLQITRANKAPAGTRTSSPENSPRWCLDRPCELQAWAVVRAGRTRLPMKQQRFLRCSASAKSHGSLLVCSDSCGRAVARQHTQAHLNPVRGACSALQACCSSTSTPQPRTQRRANEVTCPGRPAGQQGSCKVKRSEIGPTGVLYSWIFRQSKEHPRPATASRAAAAAAPMITQCQARERVHGKARSATNTLMCDTSLAQRDQRGEHE